MKDILLVGIGGFAGSVCRYLVGLSYLKAVGAGFPYGTLTVNLVGSLLIGFLAGSLLKMENNTLQLFMLTGFCGGFTTFSSFSLEGLKMLRGSQYLEYAGYVGFSVFGGILLCFLGIWVGQKLFS